MDESRFFDSNIEKMMGIITAFSSLEGNEMSAETILKTAMPYIDPQIKKKLAVVVKAMSINRLIQKYSKLSAETQQIKNSRRDMLAELRDEFDPHNRQVLDLFIKFTEIKEIMDTVTI